MPEEFPTISTVLKYPVYGLRIQCSEPLLGISPLADNAPPDLRVEFGYLPNEIIGSSSERAPVCESPTLTCMLVHHAKDYFHVKYADGTEFVISGEGSQVWCAWPDSLTIDDACLYLLGPVLGLVQQLRGRTLLHASAVVVNDVAVVLLGGPGAGKSTTAGMFSSLGYSVLSDDAVPLMLMNGAVLAQPGYPLLRLWPESAKLLCENRTALRRMTPTWEKLYLDLLADNRRFETTAKPLGAIYILADRSTDAGAPYLETVLPTDAVLSFIANPYPGFLYLESRRASDLMFFAEMLKSGQVRVKKAVPHADLSRLPQLCQLILQDLAG